MTSPVVPIQAVVPTASRQCQDGEWKESDYVVVV